MIQRCAKPGSRFTWHDAAQLVAPDGARFGPETRDGAGLPGALFAEAAAGRAFAMTPRGLEAAACGAQPAFECETSGSTGTPKRIRRSQASWLASFAINRTLFDIGPGARVAAFGSLAQSLSLYAAVEALHLGAELHLLTGLRPGRQRARLAAAEMTHGYATPAQLRQLARARGPACPTLRRLLVGGGTLDGAARAAAGALFPNAVLTEFYGASETSFITISGPETPPGAVGAAYPGVEIEIRDTEGHAVPPGTLGEVWVASPYLFEGYAAGFSLDTRRLGRFLTVGELGHLDAAGQLHLAGRRSRMITVADQNVFLDAVEAVLLGLPGVAEAAVIAEPDALRGHVLAGFVQLAPGGETDEILRRCREILGPLRTPKRLRAVTDWPMLASGKTDRAALARLGG